jgi:hypothetical protein
LNDRGEGIAADQAAINIVSILKRLDAKLLGRNEFASLG